MSKLIYDRLCRLIALALLFPTTAAAATIDIDTVLGPGHLFPGESIVVVDGASPPTKLTVLDGAVIGWSPGGGEVETGIDAFGNSVVEVLGGRIGGYRRSALLHDQSLFYMTDGVAELIESRDMSRVVVTGGEWGAVHTYGVSRAWIDGGESGYSRAFHGSRIVLNGGRAEDIELVDDATFVMHDGILDFGLIINGRGRALLNGGYTYIAIAQGQSELTVRGGVLIDTIVAAESGIIRIYGTGLHYAEDDLNPNVKYIRGTLADGTELEVFYRIRDQGQIIFHEVPEPATWALLAIGVAVLLLRRRHPTTTTVTYARPSRHRRYGWNSLPSVDARSTA
ncbi:MAG: PEP-CTERM sorting domain-containing protein [Planctomycetia bacterium]|nr:PEP-CTERM sorting domain-containing protein [Planctomycetia bacterium]